MPLDIKHDGTLDIAEVKSRKDGNAKNKQRQWSYLVEKLSATHYTAETYAEYISLKRDRQDEIKDIGGFIGGYCVNGQRKAGSVLHRQLVTLDMDYGKKDLWEDITLLYGCAALIYSTHKHKPEAPRYRVVIPLDREVSPDEFRAISRRIADTLGIEYFDHSTSYKPSQIMYWPSTAKDGAYDCEYQDGPWLSADEVLSTYRDWKDSSEWPMSTRENTVINNSIKKQGDPLEKPGVVGAFCRTYDIHQAIETFLSDVYEPCDVENRYTFKEGSTSAGVIIYEDKYAFSHHGTDPISGKLCNAFDLVRLHKFGLKDEDVKEGTVSVKLPSFLAMLDFANADPKTKKLIVNEKLNSVLEDFGGLSFEASEEEDDSYEDENDDWQTQLDTDRKGNFLSTINNIFLIIENDKKLKGRIAFDEFENRLIAKKNLPWRVVTPFNQDFTDDDDECLAHYLESKKIPFSYVQKALAKIRITHSFHPVREYLSSVKWDRGERIESLFIDYLGAEDSDYTRAITRKTLIAGVARIYSPGCKFDNVPVIIGKQGIGKSTLISKLGRQWFSNNLGDVHSKEAMENLRGVWIMEIGEFAKLKNAEVEAVKNYIASTIDMYRPAYGRKVARFPRQCVFIGSTNIWDFLRDPSGNRRFWPVATGVTEPVKSVFDDLTDYEIDQIWAEAVVYYRRKESLDLSDEIKQAAETIQESHMVESGQTGIIQDYLEKLLPEDWEDMNLSQRRGFLHYDDELERRGTIKRDKVCVAEVWCELFKKEKGDMNGHNTREIHDTLRKLKGWGLAKSNRKFSIYGLQRAYVRLLDGKNINADKHNINTVRLS